MTDVDVYLTPEEFDEKLCAPTPPRADVDPEIAPAQMAVRRARQQTVRGDHASSRVLPDPHRTGIAAAMSRARSPRSRAPEMLVELGSGSSEKTRLLLDALERARTSAHLRTAGCLRVGSADRGWRSSSAEYPEADGARRGRRLHRFAAPSAPRGSPDGGFPRGHDRQPGARGTGRVPLRTRRRSSTVASGCCSGRGWWWIPAVLIPAYDDAAGVTAEFDRNVLRVLNNASGRRVRRRSFVHVRVWDADERVDRDAPRGRASTAMTVQLPDLGRRCASPRGSRCGRRSRRSSGPRGSARSWIGPGSAATGCGPIPRSVSRWCAPRGTDRQDQLRARSRL